ncbi:hypothetical protein SHL15_0134 [Streptomyces hygroscopicus subsp. limoneus]|nr:hypothetical protein SHL15_0134 [Streptomyces hygroscopicus subsp. limoneus]
MTVRIFDRQQTARYSARPDAFVPFASDASNITGTRLHKKAGAAFCRPGAVVDGRLGRSGRLLTINVAVLLAVIVFFRLRRRTEARSRNDEKLTVVIVLALGVLIAPTPAGQGIGNLLGQLASGVTQAGR